MPTPLMVLALVSLTTASPSQSDNLHEVVANLAVRGERLLAEVELSGDERRSLERAIRDYGAHSKELVSTLVDVVQARRDRGQLAGSTLTLALSALDLAESIYGEEDPYLAESILIPVGYLLHVDTKLNAAKETFEWTLRLLRRSSGPESPEVASAMSRLGGVLFDLGRRDEAVQLARRALRILERNFGESDPRLTPEIFRLGNLLFMEGKYREAASHYKRAIGILGQETTPDEGALSRGLHNLGETYRRMGELDRSEELLRRALRIRTRADQPGEPPWPQAASTYTTLGELFQAKGEFSKAQYSFEAALKIIPNWFGKDADRYAEILSLLAVLLEETGNWERALQLQTESLEIRLAKLDADRDPRIARTRSRLGALFIREGNLTRAGNELELAQDIQEETLGGDHTDLADTLVRKAAWRELRSELSLAEADLARAIAIYEKISPDHPALIEPLEQLARVRRKLDDVTGAENAIERGGRLAESYFGPDSPVRARLFHEQARLLARRGRVERAIEVALRGETLARGHVRATVHALPEQQALNFIDSQRGNLALALSLLENSEEVTQSLLRSTWDALIRSRGIVLESLVARSRIVRARSDPALHDLARALSEARSRLAGLIVRPAGDLPPGTQAVLIRGARSDIEVAERRLSEASAPFLRSRSAEGFGFSDVARGLPPRAGLVAFIRFPYLNETASVTRYHYAAFILSGSKRRVTFVSLGPADIIDAHVREWRELMPAGLDGLQASENAVRRAGARLLQTVWTPLMAALGEDARVFLVPDGSLNLVNFGALPLKENRYLLEDGPLLHMLSTERELVTLQGPQPKAEGLLAFGGADFDAVPPMHGALATSSSRDAAASDTRALKECALPTRRFAPLPGTKQEVLELVQLWTELEDGQSGVVRGTAVSFIGADASESNWKRNSSSFRILHLATHGFFQEEECVAPRRGTRSVGSVSSARPWSYQQYALSGLALAGVNRTEPLAPNEEDGFLTALETASEDLSRVEWAVLSACDTGVGKVRPGEGTFGLRRAFAIAGARTLIMSLWSVQDAETARWMRELYTARLRDSLGTAEAVRRASLRVLAARRNQHLSTHPVFWAGFVASGDWK